MVVFKYYIFNIKYAQRGLSQSKLYEKFILLTFLVNLGKVVCKTLLAEAHRPPAFPFEIIVLCFWKGNSFPITPIWIILQPQKNVINQANKCS